MLSVCANARGCKDGSSDTVAKATDPAPKLLLDTIIFETGDS